MTPKQGYKKLLQGIEKGLGKEVADFSEHLVKVAPVDTHLFEESYTVERRGKYSYRIQNRVPYAGILALGRFIDRNGVMRGSLQWRYGLSPEIDRFKVKLWRAFNERV